MVYQNTIHYTIYHMSYIICLIYKSYIYYSMSKTSSKQTFLTNANIINQLSNKDSHTQFDSLLLPYNIMNNNQNSKRLIENQTTPQQLHSQHTMNRQLPLTLPLSLAYKDKDKSKDTKKINKKQEFDMNKIRKGRNDRIFYEPPTENYYSSFPIKPGVSFIKALFDHDNAEKGIKSLRINIPETYWNNTEIIYVYNNPDMNNELTLIKNRRDIQPFHSFLNIEKSYYDREFSIKDNILPFLVIRGPSGSADSHETYASVERFESALDASTNDNSQGIVQRYIRCKGKNRKLINKEKDLKANAKAKSSNVTLFEREKDKEKDKEKVRKSEISFFPDIIKSNSQGGKDGLIDIKDLYDTGKNDINSSQDNNKIDKNEGVGSYTKPSIIRIEYKTRYNNSKSPNFAYYLMNKRYLEPEIEKNKEKLKKDKENYTRLCIVNSIDPNSYEIYNMAGESLRPYEFYCNEIVNYIHRWYKFLLKTIVIDFIKDERGVIYFLGVKAFTPLYETDKLSKQLSNIAYIKDEKNINKIYKTITCRMCFLSYPKNKITKIVTFKLIQKLNFRLEKRNVFAFGHVDCLNIKDSELCKVCDLCYKLLLTDEELLELERTIAMSMNISANLNDKDTRFENRLVQKKAKTMTLMGKNDENNKVKFKIKSLTQFRILFYFIRVYNLDISKIEFQPNVSYKLYIKVFDQKFSIPIFEDSNKIVSLEEIELNFSKVFYFFSSDVSSLKSILKNEVIDFRIVKNENYEFPFAQCQTQCFFFFENDVKTFRIKNIFNFFSEEISFFKMQIYIGLTNDEEVSTHDLILYNYRLLSNIYLTLPSYFSYHPLPDDWHELFVPEGIDFKENQHFTSNEIDKVIGNIILSSGFEEYKPDRILEEEDIYDPFDTLYLLQKKKDTISKIKSIAMIQDKDPWESVVENKKKRPLTSNIVKMYGKDNEKDGDEYGKIDVSSSNTYKNSVSRIESKSGSVYDIQNSK